VVLRASTTKEYLVGCYFSKMTKYGRMKLPFLAGQITSNEELVPRMLFLKRGTFTSFKPQHVYFTRMYRPGVLHSCDSASVLDIYLPASVDRTCPIVYLTAVYRLPTVLT